MELTIEYQDDIAILELIGKISRDTVAEIEESMKAIILKGITKIIIDLKNVYYIDSLGLGTIFQLIRKMSLTQISMVLCRIHADVLEVFEITGIKNHFDIFDNLEEAKLYLLSRT